MVAVVPEVAPGPDVNISHRLLGSTGAIIGLCIIVYGLRIATRVRPTFKLGWDDGVMTAAMICALTAWMFICLSVHYGLGRHNVYIPPHQIMIAAKMLYLSQIPTICSAPLVKISVALMLRRLKQQSTWRWLLNIAIAVHIIIMVAAVTVSLTHCRPLAFMWDQSIPNVTCLSKKTTDYFWYFVCAIITLTDIIFSLVPIAFMYKMHIPLREKVVLCLLMALGLFASSVVIIRTTTFRRYKRAGDKLWFMSDITIWNLLEGELGILAACIPYLKSTFERGLKKLVF